MSQLFGQPVATVTLYHGTSDRFLTDILKRGLAPRGEADSNWEAFPSRPDMVYLTSAYPLYFAQAATEDGERLLIVEVERASLDVDLLHPDEDVIAQSISHQLNIDLETAQEQVLATLERYQHHWEDALNAMGNVAYKGTVEAESITRIARIDLAKLNVHLSMAMMDPMITPLNYRIKGAWYRHFVKWVFGDEPELPQLLDARWMAEHGMAGSDKHLKAHIELNNDRSSIELVTL